MKYDALHFALCTFHFPLSTFYFLLSTLYSLLPQHRQIHFPFVGANLHVEGAISAAHLIGEGDGDHLWAIVGPTQAPEEDTVSADELAIGEVGGFDRDRERQRKGDWICRDRVGVSIVDGATDWAGNCRADRRAGQR